MPTAKRPTSGLATHTSMVALTPSRAVTSHLRRHYERHYRGRFRFAPWVFLFDMALLTAVIWLVIANIWFRIAPPPAPSGLRLVFSAAPLAAVTPQALEAKITASEASHGRVLLTWELPPNTEIISANPPLTVDHQIDVGLLKKDQTVVSRVVVRLFATRGDETHIGFRVRDDQGYFAGEETRRIEESGIDFYQVMHTSAVVPQGAFPVMIRNKTGLPMDALEMNGDGALIEGESRYFLPVLGPYEKRLVLVKLLRHEPVIQLVSRGSIVDRLFMTESIMDAAEEVRFTGDPQDPRPQITLLPSQPGKPARLHVETEQSFGLVIYHPLLAVTDGDGMYTGAFVPYVASTTPVTILDVEKTTQDFELPLTDASTKETQWYAFPILSLGEGVELMLEPVTGVITTPFTVSASARYYAATGDQIGVGPLPPQVGKETKYWISWKLGPTNADVSDVDVRALLLAGARLTGRYALPDGGSMSQQGEDVVWHFSSLPASPQGVTASFEVSLTPKAIMRGHEISLVSPTRAQATEDRSGVLLEAITTEVVTTALIGDERAQGKGVVR